MTLGLRRKNAALNKKKEEKKAKHRALIEKQQTEAKTVKQTKAEIQKFRLRLFAALTEQAVKFIYDLDKREEKFDQKNLNIFVHLCNWRLIEAEGKKKFKPFISGLLDLAREFQAVSEHHGFNVSIHAIFRWYQRVYKTGNIKSIDTVAKSIAKSAQNGERVRAATIKGKDGFLYIWEGNTIKSILPAKFRGMNF